MDDSLRTWPPPDVCIVGAGPAGITTALALGPAGRGVVLLESGGTGSARRAQELNDGDHEGAAVRRARSRPAIARSAER